MGAPSIALTSLKIRDFRGVESLDLDFRGPDDEPNRLVVLGGPNGGGKTTVLEAGFLVLGGRKELVDGPVGRDAIRRGAGFSSIEASVSGGAGCSWDERLYIEDSMDRSAKPSTAESVEYFSSRRAVSLVGAVNPAVRGRRRRPPKGDRDRLYEVKQALVNAWTRELAERGGSMGAAASKPPRNEPAAPSYSEIKEAVDKAWRTFHPDRRQSFDVGFAGGNGDDEGLFDVFLETRPGRPPIPVDFLSAGQLELFLFLASLALAGDRPGIVFIDEPELHLDSQWHRAIVRTLLALRPKAQFIVATHSSEVYAEAKSYERHFLVPTDDPRVKAWAWAVPTRDGA